MWEAAKFSDLKRQGVGSVIRDRHGRTMKKSRNLRGLIEYAPKAGELKMVTVMECRHLEEHGDTKYGVAFYWPEGVHGLCVFADWRVLLTFMDNARNSRQPEYLKVSETLYDAVCAHIAANADRKRMLPGTVILRRTGAEVTA